MKTIVAVLAAFAFVVFAFTVAAPLSAHAADVFVTSMSSTDAGPTNAAAFPNRKATYRVECSLPGVYKVCTSSTCSPANGTDKRLECNLGQGTTTPSAVCTSYQTGEFESAGYAYVATIAADAGNPACNLFQIGKNP